MVKICGMTCEEDAALAAELGADAVGLMFYEGSPRCVTFEKAASIVRQLPPWVAKVGVFVNPTPELVIGSIAAAGLTMLQFHGEEEPEFCSQFGLMSIKAFRIKDRESLATISSYRTDAWLLDSYVPGVAGGTGHTFNWNLAKEVRDWGRPVFLAGGLTSENVGEAVRIVAPYGVDVSSGVESTPGRKDPEKMRQFMKAVGRE